MRDFIVTTRGSNVFVFKLTENVYVQVCGKNCLFSKSPQVYYKFGYYEKPTSIDPDLLKKAIGAVNEAVTGITARNSYKLRIQVTAEEVKYAWEKFTVDFPESLPCNKG